MQSQMDLCMPPAQKIFCIGKYKINTQTDKYTMRDCRFNLTYSDTLVLRVRPSRDQKFYPCAYDGRNSLTLRAISSHI